MTPSDADYWDCEDRGKEGAVDIRLNPRRPSAAEGLEQFLRSKAGIGSAVVVSTSGSSGRAKFAVLEKEALLASARAVVRRLGCGPEDVWLASLPDFHVGGLGIFARAHVSGARVVRVESGKWNRDGSSFANEIKASRATHTALTPTHLYDLVSHGVRAPESIQAVLLGGGIVVPEIVARARELGWPVRTTYGMTETCSQVATSIDDSIEWLPVLPIWEVRITEEGKLALRGEALFTGYAIREGEGWGFDAARDREGWFLTGDRCGYRDGCLRFEGRADDLVKVSGEWVSLHRLNQHVLRLGIAGAVVAVPHQRRGRELVLAVEGETGPGAERLLRQVNETLPGIERLGRVFPLPELPRTPIGKIDFVRLREIAGPG